MTWTTPKTWGTEVLTSADMNTYLSDNTQYLYDQLSSSSSLAKYSYTRNSTNYSTTSTTLVDIDATNLASTITTSGGDVMVIFSATMSRTGSNGAAEIAIEYNGATYSLLPAANTSGGINVSFSHIFTNVSAGEHTFRMQWLKSAAPSTILLYGTYVHFSVRELI